MPPAIRNLTERRVPQVLAIYLGAAFGIVQFVDFVGSRYLLPPVWTDLTLLAMALLLPSVLLYTYNHGRPGPDEWRRSEKVFIPINLLVLVALVTVVGAGAPLGPTSKRITVTDEQGNQREAVVPNKAFRKRVAMFLFDGNSAEAQWLQFGLPWMVFQDLQQQSFIEVMPSVLMREGLRKVGFETGFDVPLSLKRTVVQELHIPHFVAGKIEKVGNEYVTTVQLYETSSLKLIKERSYRSNDPAQLPDQISAGLVEDLQIPVMADGSPDMPVSELLTKNPEALRKYVAGAEAYANRNDFVAAADLFMQASRSDASFAAAHAQLYVCALMTNQQQVAQTALAAAMTHSYRLPERSREMLKAEHYLIKQDFPRAFAVLDMLAQMYPDDIQVQQLLLRINDARDNKDAVIAGIKKILSLDPSRAELLLQLGQKYEAKGDDGAALKEYESYAAKYPQDPRAHRRIGNLQRRGGKTEAARASYEKALLIEPGDVSVLVEFAHLDRSVGSFPQAEAKYQQALESAKTPEARMQVLRGLAGLYEFRGQIRRSIETTEKSLLEVAKFAPPAQVTLARLPLPGAWARIDAATAERELRELRQSIPAAWSLYQPVADLLVYTELDDAVRTEQATNALDQLVKQSNMRALQVYVAYGRGRVAELRGDCASAVRSYRELAAIDPTDLKTHTYIGRCLRKQNQHREAQAELNKVLAAMPAHGEANLEMGLLFQESGDAAKARMYLQRALNTWQGADAAFKPAQQARAALAG
jgi:tetratricopeptide (TPR) repeat protein